MMPRSACGCARSRSARSMPGAGGPGPHCGPAPNRLERSLVLFARVLRREGCMATCVACGHDFPEDAARCPACGADAPAAAAPSWWRGGAAPPPLEPPPPPTPPPTSIVPSELPASGRGLALEIISRSVTVAPGDEGHLHLVVVNRGNQTELCEVSVVGVPDSWQRVPLRRFGLGAGQRHDLDITIAVPQSARAAAGLLSATVIVQAGAGAESLEERAVVTVAVEAFHAIDAALEPAEIDGAHAARTYVNVENRGNTLEHVAFSASDPGRRLRFSFQPGELEVRPGPRASAWVDGQPRRRLWGGSEQSHRFTVAVTRREGPPAEPLQGRYIQLPGRSRWLLAAVAVVVLVAATAGAVLLWSRSSGNSTAAGASGGTTASVPDVRGLSEDGAKEALRQRALVPDVVNVYRDTDPGRVVDQDPASGATVDKNTTVKLSVSTDRKVPNVVSKPWDVAKQEIEDAHLTMVFGGWQTGDDDHENLVAWQVPDSGEPSEDGQVKVGVYSGRERLQLSSFKGLDQVSVETQLTNQGLVVKVQAEDSDQPRGIIVDH